MSVDALSDSELRTKLMEYGYPVGPVTQTTRKVLVKKLKNLMVARSGGAGGSRHSLAARLPSKDKKYVFPLNPAKEDVSGRDGHILSYGLPEVKERGESDLLANYKIPDLSEFAASIKAVVALYVVRLLTDIAATILTGLGLRMQYHRDKHKYRFAVFCTVIALVSLLALIIYPICFAAEPNLGNRTNWEFGWAYGVGWGAVIFLVGSAVLLLCEKESEEIYYKKKKTRKKRSR